MEPGHYLALGGLLVTLITAGLIPYMISKNTKQHLAGTEDRKAHSEQLNTILVNQHGISQKIDVIKNDVSEIKETRIKDKEAFLALYEKVVVHNVKHEGTGSVVD